MRKMTILLTVIGLSGLSLFAANPTSNLAGFVKVQQPQGISFGSIPLMKGDSEIIGYDLIENASSATSGSPAANCDRIWRYEGTEKKEYYLDQASLSWKNILDDSAPIAFTPSEGYGIYRTSSCEVLFLGTVNESTSEDLALHKGTQLFTAPYPCSDEIVWTAFGLKRNSSSYGMVDQIFAYASSSYQPYFYDTENSLWKKYSDLSVLDAAQYQSGKSMLFDKKDGAPDFVTITQPAGVQ